MAVCVARQVTQSYLPKVLKPKESELDAKARKIQQKIEEKLARKISKSSAAGNGESPANNDPAEAEASSSEHAKNE